LTSITAEPPLSKRLRTATWVPRPNYVLHTSPEKFQIVWKVEDMTIKEAEALNRAMVREFDGDPAATDSTRVLRLPGFANKKYEADFYVQAHTESTQAYHLRDFKLQIDSPDAPRHQHEEVARKPLTQSNTLSQSEHDWAYAMRALARGDVSQQPIECRKVAGRLEYRQASLEKLKKEQLRPARFSHHAGRIIPSAFSSGK
jgi:hypothetical protein